MFCLGCGGDNKNTNDVTGFFCSQCADFLRDEENFKKVLKMIDERSNQERIKNEEMICH